MRGGQRFQRRAYSPPAVAVNNYSWEDGANAAAAERRLLARILGKIIAVRHRCSPNAAGPTRAIGVVVAIASLSLSPLGFTLALVSTFKSSLRSTTRKSIPASTDGGLRTLYDLHGNL